MKVTIIPNVIGAFGTVTKGLLNGLEDLEVRGQEETIQTTALLRTARILRRVLEICCPLNSSERPSALADVKNSKGLNITTNNYDYWKLYYRSVRIYCRDVGMEFGREKWAILIMKTRKKQMTDGMEQPNQEKRKSTNSFGILVADTIKQVERKENLKKSISGEPESYSRQNYIAGTLSKR